ncbi:hypothetical protein [Microcoleus sp. bin38.metabat.b11b12b14.051]|nr:hypothetical protein [Microcoleus sp. bin38.metabat.b11b12b14.051]
MTSNAAIADRTITHFNHFLRVRSHAEGQWKARTLSTFRDKPESELLVLA